MSARRVRSALGGAARRALGLLIAGASVLGCNPQLPGPLECERMTYAVIQRTPTDAVVSPKVRRVADRLIQGCLTVPFDKRAVTCASQGYSFLRCMDDLGRRAPERKQALRALVTDLDQLGAGG